MTDIKIENISLEQTDKLIRELRSSGGKLWNCFKIAFSSEANKIFNKEKACSSGLIYYLISANDNRCLLVSIDLLKPKINQNIDCITLSSLARIVIAEKPQGEATACLKELIESRLVPMCKKLNKNKIQAKMAMDALKVEKLFKRLKKDKPKGIKKICITDDNGGRKCVMELS